MLNTSEIMAYTLEIFFVVVVSYSVIRMLNKRKIKMEVVKNEDYKKKLS